MKNLTVLENLTTHGRHVRVNGDLVVDFNGNGWPSEFTSDTRGARARKTLQDIALIDDLPILNQKLKEKLEALFDLDAANISIWQKFSALSDAKKADFHFDFRQVNKTTLIALNNEPELIDAWAELVHLRKFSTNLDFLRAFRFIALDPRCADFRNHIVNGEIKAGKAQGFHTKLGQNNGKAQIIEVVEEANTKGYYTAKVQVVNPNPPPPYIIKEKSGIPMENDMFPDHWDANKIFEEVSYAFTNKNRVPRKYNQWKGYMSDGNPCIICINNTAHIIDGTTVIKTAWPIKTF